MVVVSGSQQAPVPVDEVWSLLGDVAGYPRWFPAPVFYLLWPLMMRARARETMRLTLDQLKSAFEEGIPRS